MNSKQKLLTIYDRIDKSLTELLEVLSEIDEDDVNTLPNETSIDDNNGGRILLDYSPEDHELTISKARLKLVVSVPTNQVAR